MLLDSSDEQLVDFVLGGDDEAFEVLFDRHVADAVWFARDVLGSWGEAEEAVRHSFAAAHAYLASRDRQIEFAPWLHTILSNHCLSMLQARGPRPGESAAVIDLEEWRRRRTQLGVAAPVAGATGLREGVMAACGIGGGAAATSAPLLGGTVAKLAVVAVLAGSAGVAGQAAPDHDPARDGGPAAADVGQRMAPTAWAGGMAAAPKPGAADRPSGSARDGRHVAPVGARPPPQALNDDAPAADSPAAGAPGGAPAPPTAEQGADGGAPVAPAPASPATKVDEAATAVEQPARSPLQRTTDVLRSVTPAPPSSPPQVALPAPGDLPAIGDDLQVTTGKLTADVRALLTRGTNAPPE